MLFLWCHDRFIRTQYNFQFSFASSLSLAPSSCMSLFIILSTVNGPPVFKAYSLGIVLKKSPSPIDGFVGAYSVVSYIPCLRSYRICVCLVTGRVNDNHVGKWPSLMISLSSSAIFLYKVREGVALGLCARLEACKDKDARTRPIVSEHYSNPSE